MQLLNCAKDIEEEAVIHYDTMEVKFSTLGTFKITEEGIVKAS